MKSNRERIEWFIRFTEMDFAKLRPGDWLNLRNDIWLLIQGLPLEKEAELLKVPLNLEEEEQRLTLENLTHVQQYVKGLLRRFAGNTSHGQNSTDLFMFEERVRGPIRDVLFVISRTDPTFWVVVRSAHLQDVFLFALAGALSGIDIKELHTCPLCEQIFLADHGRQKFCSLQCKNKAAQQRFRQTHKEKENQRGKENYEKKIKKKLGAKVQIKKRTNVRQGGMEK